MDGAVDGGDPVQVGLGDLDASDASPAASALRPSSAAVQPGQVVTRSRLTAPPPGSAARGTAAARPGRAGQRLLGGQAGTHDVVAEDVGQRHGVRGRRDVVGGDLADRRDRLEDHGELRGEVVELGVVEVDPGEVRQVRDLVAGDLGHGGNPRCAQTRRANRPVDPAHLYEELMARPGGPLARPPTTVTSPSSCRPAGRGSTARRTCWSAIAGWPRTWRRPPWPRRTPPGPASMTGRCPGVRQAHAGQHRGVVVPQEGLAQRAARPSRCPSTAYAMDPSTTGRR